ncbi:hypothetical protein LAZ67_19002092 [Cordylochernes scorpioides]|uniref:Uncharacterized protein n=1 Tax=Cordylochernes scorpioides TaxID=51811 RepID=A0ABY6LL29_9ARAC|nr:hypothetical protein LAZ67_19002092 [Cordylochernes scorpioides]
MTRQTSRKKTSPERTQQPQTREEISGPITRSRALRLRMQLQASIMYFSAETDYRLAPPPYSPDPTSSRLLRADPMSPLM